MKTTSAPKKLVLNRQTLRILSQDEMAGVAGGIQGPRFTDFCASKGCGPSRLCGTR